MTVPIAQPSSARPSARPSDRVLASGMLTQGAEVAAFETEFAATVGGRECVALASGHLGAAPRPGRGRIGPGDEVIVPAFTFAATANAVVHAGARPVFADIDPATYCLDPASASAAVTSRTAAIIPVHLYGHPADMDAINRLARDRGLLVLEDACQAQGARYRDAAGRRAGRPGGGQLLSHQDDDHRRGRDARLPRPADRRRRRGRCATRAWPDRVAPPTTLGYNARMTDVAAAIGRVQLRRVDDFLERPPAHAARWDAALPDRSRPAPRRGRVSGVPRSTRSGAPTARPPWRA